MNVFSQKAEVLNVDLAQLTSFAVVLHKKLYFNKAKSSELEKKTYWSICLIRVGGKCLRYRR